MEKNNLKILNKLHKIMEATKFIEKDKRNTFHGYDYASEQAIKEKLHKELVKNKVLFSLDVGDVMAKTVTTSKGAEEQLIIINTKYTFTDIESGEKFEGSFAGTGQDSGDKGLYKAITGSIKYILTSTFLVPTGDDPEKDTNKSNKTNSKFPPNEDAFL